MKPIGVYGLTNTASIAVYSIDYHEDMVLAGYNNDNPEWCKMDEENDEFGFYFGELFVPFNEVMRI